MTTGVIGQVLHLQKTNLVQAPSEDIDDVAIVRSALGQVIIKLLQSVSNAAS